ncbi:MAG: hypothetical protein QOJ15_2958, partial [Bradyrhizobium sp.]|nr:hypothetical protein [Bradyrhizobium sp.]
LLHALGLLDAWSLSSIPPASNAAAFDAAMPATIAASPHRQPRKVSRSKASFAAPVGGSAVAAGVGSWFMPAVF